MSDSPGNKALMTGAKVWVGLSAAEAAAKYHTQEQNLNAEYQQTHGYGQQPRRQTFLGLLLASMMPSAWAIAGALIALAVIVLAMVGLIVYSDLTTG